MVYSTEVQTVFDEIYSECPPIPKLKWRKIRKEYYPNTIEEEMLSFLKKEEMSNNDRIKIFDNEEFIKKNSGRFGNKYFSPIFGNRFMDNIFVFEIIDKINFYTNLTENLTYFSIDRSENLVEIWRVYNFVKRLSKIQIDNQRILLFGIDLKKEMNERGTFEFSNINSGVCINFNTIIIWRKEEMPKVLCHELVHMLQLDYVLDSDNFPKLARRLFKISSSSPSIPNEGITDCLTLFIMSYINSKKIGMDSETVFREELEWTCQLMYNIWSKLNQNMITYETDVISYYFIKGFLMFQLTQDETFIQYFLFGTIIGGQKKYSKIQEILHNVEFLNKFKQYYNSIEKKVFTSLKMSKFT